MDPFDVTDEKLLDFYHLKSLNPSTSWKQDSSLLIDLNRWQDVTPTADNSYDMLKDLMSQQQRTTERETDLSLKDAALNYVSDPWSNERMLPLLNRLDIPKRDTLKYLINSKQFNVKAFLRDIHKTDSFEELSNSLDNLDKTLESQSEELKDLVQANFTKYVRVKNRLDQIYEQFSEKTTPAPPGDDSSQLDVARLGEKVDESIRATTLKLKPLLKTSKKISNYQTTKQFIEENREFFNLPRTLRKCVEKNDYANLMFEYTRATELYHELTETCMMGRKAEGVDGDVRNPKVVEKIWNEVERTVEDYRQQTWKRLITPSENESQQYFLPLISKLLDLKIGQNPIMAWITTRLDNFEKQLDEVSTLMLPKIVHSQQAIIKNGFDANEANALASVDGVDLTYYLSINQFFQGIKSNESTSTLSVFQDLTDSPIIVETWLIFIRYICLLQGICTAFIEVWEHVQNFLGGAYQASLINDKKKDNILVGVLNTIDSHKRFLQLEDKQIKEIRTRGEHFVTLFFGKLLLFFQSSQGSLPRNEKIEKETGLPFDYGFIPPRANGLSCLRYLPKMIEPLMKSITELAQLGISSMTLDSARKLASVITDRCVGAIASTRLRDISNFYKLEDWTVYETVTGTKAGQPEYGVTQFPEIIRCFQEYSIRITRDILFAFERLPVFNGISIVSYPSKQILTAVEIQQLISLEAVLEAILKNAAKDKDNPRNSHTILTLTNLQYIRETTFPQILQYFDEAFEWNLKEKKLELFTLLSKMESSIFGNYLSELKINIRDILEEKFHEISWASYTSKSFRAGDYIIEVLMLLVTIHSECFRIGPQLINKILKETQIFVSKYLFEAFKPYIGNLSSDGILQVTVDLQFFQRVLGSLLEKDTEVTLTACLQNCFQNNIDRMQRCIKETEPIVSANLSRTSTQFAAFK